MKPHITFATLLVPMLLVACANPIDRRTDAELAAIRVGPQASPQRNATNFSDGLRCMDQLLFDYGVRDVTMMMEEFQDNSRKLGAGTRDMMVSAVSDMTRRSRAVRLQTFGTDNQNIIQLLQQAQKANQFSAIPEFDLRGSITQFDEDVLKRQGTFGAIVEGLFGVRAGRTSQVSVMGFDASMIRTKDLALVPGVTSRNTIALGREEASAADGQARINKANLSFTFAINRAEGSAQAVRNMVELAGIEVVGKLTRVPYWSCLNLSVDHPEVKREIDDWFFGMRAPAEKRTFFQEHLRGRGFFDGPLDGKPSKEFDDALKAYKVGLKLAADTNIDRGFFQTFLEKPVPPAPAVPFTVAAKVETKTEGAAKDSAIPAAQIEHQANTSPLTLTFDKTTYKSGETIALTITTTRSGYLYCYTEDGKTNALQRVYPNRFVQDPRVEFGQTISLPGAGAFKIEAQAGATQRNIGCMLAPREVYNGLPPPLRWGDFEDVRLPSIEAIQTEFAKVAKAPVALERGSVRVEK
jgi:curli biogenesis system outer membrane secretion channel CsgG